MTAATAEQPAPEAATTTTTNSRIVSNIPTRVLSSLSISEQYYILEGCRDNCRLDGRTRTALQPFTLLANDPLVLSHGSSRIVTASTEILCSVKAELVHPSAEAPNEGVVEFHVDIGSDIGGDFRKRRLTEHQLQASLNYLLQFIVPLSSLCVVPGQYVWRLHCDLVFLRMEGGSVVDLASRALRGALWHTKLPLVTALGSTSNNNNKGRQAQMDLAVDGDIQNAHSVVDENDDSSCPIIVSVAICKCPPKSTPVLVLDTTLEEESCASCIVRLAVTPSGEVAAVQTASGSLPLGLLPQVTATAVQASKEVYEAMQNHTVLVTPNGGGGGGDTMLQEQFQIR